jgi:hypothetical protein
LLLPWEIEKEIVVGSKISIAAKWGYGQGHGAGRSDGVLKRQSRASGKVRLWGADKLTNNNAA